MPKKPTPNEAPKKGAVKATPKKAEVPKAAAAQKQAPKKEAPKKAEAPKKVAKKQEAPKKAAQKQAPKKQAGAKVVKKTQRRKAVFKVHDSVFEKKARIFGIGGHLPPKKDMTRYVRWPKYIRLQRQRRVLYQRLKVPPSINQFARTFDKHTAFRIFKLAEKYKPETLKAKRQRLVAAAKARVKGSTSAPPPRPLSVRAGINEVTSLVERKKAKLVVIAHDVDPIELVVWLPALCKKLKVPYCIVKSKSRLGTLVGRSTCACFAFTNVRNQDQEEIRALAAVSRETYNDKYDENRKSWGGGILGLKARHALAKRKVIKTGK